VDLGSVDSVDSAALVITFSNVDTSNSYSYHRIRLINENGGNIAGFAEITFKEKVVKCKVSN
jgi:hypothetical protein